MQTATSAIHQRPRRAVEADPSRWTLVIEVLLLLSARLLFSAVRLRSSAGDCSGTLENTPTRSVSRCSPPLSACFAGQGHSDDPGVVGEEPPPASPSAARFWNHP